MSTRHSLSGRAGRLSLVAVALASVFYALPAQALLTGVPVTVDVSQLGLTGASFTTNAFKATEVSHITFLDANGNWYEHGIAQITGINSAGGIVTPTGMNSSYTLYMDFQGTGNIALQTFNSAVETIYVAEGAATFGLDGNHDAFVDNGGRQVWTLAHSNLILGTTSPPVGDLYANLLGTFETTTDGKSVFVGPQPFPGEWLGVFFHSSTDGNLIPLIGAQGLEGFAITGGDDTLVFVPEPGSLLLTAGAMAGASWMRRRRLPV